MSTMPLARLRPSRNLSGPAGFAAAVIPTAIVAILLDAAVAAIARGAGVSHHFKPLHFGSYTSLTVFGIIAGAAGWSLIRSRATDPESSLRRIVPVVLVLSFIPDIGMGLSKSMAATSWGGVAALMIMHLLVAAVALPAYAVFLPVEQTSPAKGSAAARP